MTRPCVVFLNLDCGRCVGRETVDELRKAFAPTALEPTILAVRGRDLQESLSALDGSPSSLVVAAGGDGTVRTVATALVGSGHTLGVLPMGTVNHLARDLGIPIALDRSVEALVSGTDRRIDVGEVNGELFLNACALGVYAELARLRERRRHRHPTWPAAVRWVVDLAASLGEVLRSWPLLRLQLRLDGERLQHRVPLLVVANNPILPLTEPRDMDRGHLAVYVPQAVGRLALAAVLGRAVFRGPETIRPLAVHHAHRAVIELDRPSRVVVDGEVLRPGRRLEFRSRPGACAVRAPADRSGEAHKPGVGRAAPSAEGRTATSHETRR